MRASALLRLGFVAISHLLYLSAASAVEINAERMALERRYTTPHSLGDHYVFDPRDGWQTVNTTNLLYKYSARSYSDSDSESDSDQLDLDSDANSGSDSHSDSGSDDLDSGDHVNRSFHGYGGRLLQARAKKTHIKFPKTKTKTKAKAKATKHKSNGKSSKTGTKSSPQTSGSGSGLFTGLQKIVKSIKAFGKPEPVTITWYTGHDLENPSCWTQAIWTPTDNSFAAALTLDGWETKPKCFKFLELCNSPQKCVFVRVVDSCAGCAKDSKHVDLTKAAFSTLADLNQGLVTVQMREATDPLDGWLENLWGPKVDDNK